MEHMQGYNHKMPLTKAQETIKDRLWEHLVPLDGRAMNPHGELLRAVFRVGEDIRQKGVEALDDGFNRYFVQYAAEFMPEFLPDSYTPQSASTDLDTDKEDSKDEAADDDGLVCIQWADFGTRIQTEDFNEHKQEIVELWPNVERQTILLLDREFSNSGKSVLTVDQYDQLTRLLSDRLLEYLVDVRTVNDYCRFRSTFVNGLKADNDLLHKLYHNAEVTEHWQEIFNVLEFHPFTGKRLRTRDNYVVTDHPMDYIVDNEMSWVLIVYDNNIPAATGGMIFEYDSDNGAQHLQGHKGDWRKLTDKELDSLNDTLLGDAAGEHAESNVDGLSDIHNLPALRDKRIPFAFSGVSHPRHWTHSTNTNLSTNTAACKYIKKHCSFELRSHFV